MNRIVASRSSPPLAQAVRPGQPRRPGAILLLVVLLAGMIAAPRSHATQFVSGFVPDWDQPYQYASTSPNGGPGPDPLPGVVNQWNAWCAPASAANLAGHWFDFHGVAVADTAAFPSSTVAWAAGPSWQDHEADGTANRPPPQAMPGPLPTSPTDIGWYMDSNRGISHDSGLGVMGGFFFNNPGHTGTYLKDVHAGLGYYLASRPDPSVILWTTKTRGLNYAGIQSPTGGVVSVHTNAAEAFGEVVQEINRNRTLLLAYLHWNIQPAGIQLAPSGSNTESAIGGDYFIWGPMPFGGNDEDEEWNERTDGEGLGHMVTAVGYIPAGDPDDPWQAAGLPGPTDWVIVHDNWAATPRNVIIPYDYGGYWVANCTADPELIGPDREEPKWSRTPDTVNGTDVQSSQPAGHNDPMGIVADDFLCDGRPISGIRWWGSYIGYATNEPGPLQPPANGPDGFQLAWYTDVPAGLMAPHSAPARPPLRVEYHPIAACNETYWTNVLHTWNGETEHEFVYRVSLSNDWNEKQDHIYWLSVAAVYSTVPGSNFWGWATTAPDRGWNDAAVRRDPVDPSGWVPLDYSTLVPPYGYTQVNMAFDLLTDVTNRRAIKWRQPPDMKWGENMPSFSSLDPTEDWTLRADDFISDGRRITDIHWWGSYINWFSNYPGPVEEPFQHPSPPATPLGFILSWHRDIPKGEPGPDGPSEFSQPGETLTNLFVPFAHCHEVYYGTVTQDWKEPLLYDHEFQYYVDLLDPDIANAAPWPEEEGIIYWLNIQAVFTNGWQEEHEHEGWGWKNTPGTLNWNDDSVISSSQYPPGWSPALYPLDNPNTVFTQFCDLAFELTTDEAATNQWSGNLVITGIQLNTNTGTRLATVGDAGAGKQYIQCNTNLVASNSWVNVATNPLPLPRPYTNWWTITASTNRTLFYRLKQR